MTVSHTLQADLQTVANVWGLTPQTVVALPPSDLDGFLVGGGFGAFADQFAGTTSVGNGGMRVYVNGVLIRRFYDLDLEQP